MSPSAKVVSNGGEFRAFLKSGEVEALMRSHAERIAKHAGSGMVPSTWQGDSRVIGSVRAETYRAMRRQASHDALRKALYASKESR